MSPRISPISENLEWQRAYMAAVLERDRTRIVDPIHDASVKLSTRLHELETASSFCDEIEAIHDADYLLQARAQQPLLPRRLGELTSAGARQLLHF